MMRVNPIVAVHNAKPLDGGDLAQVRFGLKAERPNLGLANRFVLFAWWKPSGTHTTFIGNGQEVIV